jgi:hypothetical protein
MSQHAASSYPTVHGPAVYFAVTALMPHTAAAALLAFAGPITRLLASSETSGTPSPGPPDVVIVPA